MMNAVHLSLLLAIPFAVPPVSALSFVSWLERSTIPADGTIVDEAKCYVLPSGLTGFLLHIGTGIAGVFLSRRLAPLLPRPGQPLSNGRINLTLALVSFFGVMVTGVINSVACLPRWEFLLLSLFATFVPAAMAVRGIIRALVDLKLTGRNGAGRDGLGNSTSAIPLRSWPRSLLRTRDTGNGLSASNAPAGNGPSEGHRPQAGSDVEARAGADKPQKAQRRKPARLPTHWAVTAVIVSCFAVVAAMVALTCYAFTQSIRPRAIVAFFAATFCFLTMLLLLAFTAELLYSRGVSENKQIRRIREWQREIIAIVILGGLICTDWMVGSLQERGPIKVPTGEVAAVHWVYFVACLIPVFSV